MTFFVDKLIEALMRGAVKFPDGPGLRGRRKRLDRRKLLRHRLEMREHEEMLVQRSPSSDDSRVGLVTA